MLEKIKKLYSLSIDEQLNFIIELLSYKDSRIADKYYTIIKNIIKEDDVTPNNIVGPLLPFIIDDWYDTLIKMIIVGQDPYPQGYNRKSGIAFMLDNKEYKTPKSLKNLYNYFKYTIEDFDKYFEYGEKYFIEELMEYGIFTVNIYPFTRIGETLAFKNALRGFIGYMFKYSSYTIKNIKKILLGKEAHNIKEYTYYNILAKHPAYNTNLHIDVSYINRIIKTGKLYDLKDISKIWNHQDS